MAGPPDHLLAAALSLSRTPLAIADTEGRIVAANGALAALLGFGDAGIVGRTLTDLGLAGLPSDGDAGKGAAVRSASGAEIRCEIRISRCSSDGKTWVVAAFLPPAGEGEERLRRDLALVRATEGLGRLLTGFAHDMKNVLQIVMGHGELLRRRIPATDPRLTMSLGHIAEAAERGAAAAESLMALGRLGQLPKAPHSLTALIRTVLADLSKSRPVPAGIEVRLRLSEPGPVVLCDELALRRVVEELIANALAAMGDAGVLEIHTGTATPAQGEPVAELVIRDTGKGIPPDIAEALRDPSMLGRAAGPRLTRLGLAVVGRIVREHHGTLDVVSASGAGSTIRCSFPLAAPDSRP